ncbi:galactose oxidase, partial [Cellulomonas bogoriensis 69B4 = DSM 16987]
MRTSRPAPVVRAALVAATLLLGAAVTTPATAQGATTPAVLDGSAPDRAAASCWEIKQNSPTSPDGPYWLLTPELLAPQQHWCDMTYDGGGWVLVGKGREGWQEHYLGHGDPAALLTRDRTDFSTTQLPAPTVDALLGGERVDGLTDGIRVLRARNATGTQWQNLTFQYTSRDRWVWTFSAEHRTAWYQFDGGTRWNGGATANLGRDNLWQRMTTGFVAGQQWTSGFAYGTSVRDGSTSPTTYLWSAAGNGSSPRPYAEVYLRPRLLSAELDFPDVPDSGTAPITQRPLASSYAAPGQWGVSGHFNGRTAEGNAEVQDFAQIGTSVFVAGNFARIQRGGGTWGPDVVQQAALAAFDARTGELVRTFAPVFDNQVKSVVGLPDGTLLAAGDFTEVNGVPASGTVLLDPVTGATLPAWDLHMENRISTGVLSVRSLEVHGPWVYLGGSFTHLSGGGVTNPVYARHAARVAWATGAPDRAWNPEFDGTLMDLDVHDDGGTFYAAGYFTTSQGRYANKAAAVLTVGGAPLATPTWTTVWSASDRSGYQQAIQQVGERVYAGGSEHSIFGYSTSTFERLSGSITKGVGGDFQALATDAGVIYGGCHCNSWSYQDAYTWSALNPDWTQADKISWLGAWDVATGDYLPAFNPPFLNSNNAGAWALFVDDAGTVWAGGDFTGARTSPTTSQWAGGFVRFPQVDHSAPSAPGSFSVLAADEESVELVWSPSTDDAGVTGYEVLRDDRVVAMTAELSLSVPRGGENRFAVRAVDAAGNRSASTEVLTELDPDPGAVNPLLVPAGSEW